MLRVLFWLLVVVGFLLGGVASHRRGTAPPGAPAGGAVPEVTAAVAPIDPGFTVAGPDRPIDSAFTVDGPHCVNAPGGGAGGAAPTPFDPACPPAFQGGGGGAGAP